MKRILLVKTSSLGDVIHNLPVVNDILQHFPDAQIDWVVEESFADIPRLHPKVGQVITVAMRRWRKHLLSLNTLREISAVIKKLAANKYDTVIDSQGLIKSSIITSFTNGVKHGYDKESIREPLASWGYEQKHHISFKQHAVIRNRTLAALSLNYAVPNNAPDYGIKASVNTHAIINEPFVIGLHGTSRDSKLWPTEHWIELGRQLDERQLKLVLPWASEAELKRAQQIAAALKNATVLPKLTIAQVAAVISNAQAAIGVDTGLSHLAAALNIPTIAIYTDTNPKLTGVYAGAYTGAINLGNIDQIPEVVDVLNAFLSINK
ncbi:MAG: lipopolysaccharide heptosyltransferase I [Methylotenera sp.]|uniref:lipopolysaccharide heptosyltransferase I n=1 Tax=Methylotenera sp. TaxID=2051956 RepID=UPI00248A6D35|nr:lipopolysaccharide heptosyltransferase I [Methylotenera sp.]MDI1308260.1 lipopolysaccharide heptosyltransferase I [Methylotenera sp.]